MAWRKDIGKATYKLPPGGFRVPWLQYQATSKKARFSYPFDWTTKITHNGVESGYVFGPPGSMSRLWFSLGNGYSGICATKQGPIQIVTLQPVKIAGQPSLNVVYVEAVLAAHLNPNKSVVFFGLRSKLPPFDKIQTFTGCLNRVEGGVFFNNKIGSKTLLQFESLVYGLDNGTYTFDSPQEALAYFKTAEYKQAKQIILSLVFG